MRIKTCSILTLLLAVAVAPACDDGSTGKSDRVTISNDQGDLSTHVTRRSDPVSVEPTSSPNALVLAPEVDYKLVLVAEVAPPQVDGVALQATSVAFHDNKAVVSYSMAGPDRMGAVDVFTFDADRNPNLTSRAIFDDTDVSAVAAGDGRVWLATATADETYETPAVIEALALSDDGQLTLTGHQRMPLSSYVATSVSVHNDRVYATSGNTGGVFAFDRNTYEPVGSTDLDDARWVTVDASGQVVVVQGTPGRLAILDPSDLVEFAEYSFDGATVPESKSTVEVLGGNAFIAGGPGGTFVIDVATGAQVAHIPVPTGLPLAPADVVTNAVSVDGALMFVSNGAAGVYLVQASNDLAAPVEGVAPSFDVAGRLALGDFSSANHIAYKDGFLFVATGKGGLQIVRVEPASDCAAILAAHPDATSGIYQIAPDGNTAVSTYCDMTTDGGGWTQIYDQDFATFGHMRAASAWSSVNTSSPNTGDYSILIQLPNLGNGNYYEFRHEWLDGPMADGYLQWTQDQSPLDVGDASSSATLFDLTTSLDSTPSGCGAFSGLGLSTQTSRTYLDGDHGGCWWFAVGVSSGYSDGVVGIPAYSSPNEAAGNSARHVRLWVRPAFPAPASCREILAADPTATSGTYAIDPDGFGGDEAFSVSCDMTTDGGGWTVLTEENFEAGATGWSDNTTSAACAYASTLLGGYDVFGEGATTSKTLSLLGIPHTEARVALDYVSIDNWDGEEGYVQVDGTDIFRQSFSSEAGSDRCGGPGNDRDPVDILVTRAHDTSSLELLAGSDLDQAANDASWGIDNVLVMIR